MANQHTKIQKVKPQQTSLEIYQSHKYRFDNYIGCLFQFDFIFGLMLGFIPDDKWKNSKNFCEAFEKYFVC